MSFEREWAELKAKAEGEQAERLQLNQVLPPDRPGLLVRQDDLGAVGHEAFVLHRQLRKDADVTGSFGNADKADTVRAASELTSHSFELGKALKKTNSLWTSKLRTVLQGCAHISNHLDYTKSSHHKDDDKIGATMKHPMTTDEISSHLK